MSFLGTTIAYIPAARAKAAAAKARAEQRRRSPTPSPAVSRSPSPPVDQEPEPEPEPEPEQFDELKVDPIFQYLPKKAASSYRELGQRVLDLRGRIEKSKADVTWLGGTLTWAKENEEWLTQRLQSVRDDIKHELTGADTAYIVYIMGDSKAASEQNCRQLREAREGVDTASQTMHDVANQMELTALKLEQVELEQTQIERARKQWMCESCLSAHIVSALDGLDSCCGTCGLPRSISDVQRVESENFRTQLSLAKQARAMEGRWAVFEGRVGQVHSGVLLHDDIAVQLRYSDDLSLSPHLNLYELDGPVVDTEAIAAGTEDKTDADTADDKPDLGASGRVNASKVHSDRGYDQQDPDSIAGANRTLAAGPEGVKLQLLTLRRTMGELEWALKSTEKEHTAMTVSVDRLESEAALIRREIDAKQIAEKLASATEKRRGYEEQLQAAKTSGADAAAELKVKTALLSETEMEMHKLAAKMCAVKARTDAMAARVAEVEAKRQAEIDAQEAAKQARWAAIEEAKVQKREAAAKLAQQQKAERDAQLKMEALVVAAKKAAKNYFIGMRVRVRPPRKRRFRATVATTLRQGPASDATVLGKLAPNEELTELDSVYEEGINRIRCSRGWCNAAALEAIGDGAGDASYTQCGTVVNIRVRPSADGSAPGIKVQLTSGVQHYFTFSDVVPYVFDKPEGISTENDKARYAWDEGGLSDNPNTVAERLVDEKGRAMLTYSVRRPASAAAAPRMTSGIGNAGTSGSAGPAQRPASATPQQFHRTETSRGATLVGHHRPVSARSAAGGALGAQKIQMGGLVSRTWEQAMEQQSGGHARRKPRAGGALLALGKAGNAMADTHSLLDSFLQEAATAPSVPLVTSAASGNSSQAIAFVNMAQHSPQQRPSSASAGLLSTGRTPGGVKATEIGPGVARREPIELDSSLMARSAFSLSADDHASTSSSSTPATTMTMTSATTGRCRRRQQRSRPQGLHRPASAGSLRAAVSSWGELRGRGVGLVQLTSTRSSAGVRAGGGGRNVKTFKSAWDWEDNLRALQHQSSRYAGAGITLD